MKGKKLIKKTVKAMIKKEKHEWPPFCYGLTYQPVRPIQRNEQGEIHR